MSELRTKCLIIGSGPAGYTAGIYTSRANLEPIMVEGSQPGGQLITTTEIENFPGYIEGVAGPKLMEDLRAQAVRYGLNIVSGEVTEVDFSQRPFKAVVSGSAMTIYADTVIISTGATARYLGLPDEGEISRHGRFGLCYMRRFLLPQPPRGCCRWRRHSLRRSPLPRQPCIEGIHDCT